MLYVTTTQRPTIAEKKQEARALLQARGIDPDGIADQGDVAADLNIPRRAVSYLRQQYKGAEGTRGLGRNGPLRARPEDALEPFPKPSRYVGRSPVWEPRWRVLAWDLTREGTRRRRAANASS